MECSLDFYLFILTYICPQELISAILIPEHFVQEVGRQRLFGCWGNSLCANTEEPLLSSREMFNMFLFQNKGCVCVSHPQCLSTTKWKQTQERWDSSHPWVLLLLICGSSIQTLHFSSASKALFSARKNGELLVRRSLLVTKWWSQQRCSLWHSCIPQLAALQGWGGFLWALVTLQQEGHRSSLTVPSLLCLGLVPFPLGTDCSEFTPWGRTALLAQVALPMMWIWTDHGTHSDILLELLRKHFPF